MYIVEDESFKLGKVFISPPDYPENRFTCQLLFSLSSPQYSSLPLLKGYLDFRLKQTPEDAHRNGRQALTGLYVLASEVIPVSIRRSSGRIRDEIKDSLTCRKRKLKCDEGRPVCGHCRKAQRTCVPSDGITFRHQQNASMNGSDTSGLGGFFGYKDTFNKDHVWLEIPQEVRFVHITDPYSDLEPAIESVTGILTPLGGPLPQHNRHLWSIPTSNPVQSPSFGLDTLSSVATSDPFSLNTAHEAAVRSFNQLATPISYHTPPESRPTTGHTPMSRTNTNTPRPGNTPIDSALVTPKNGLRSVEHNTPRATQIFADSVEDEHEIAFLMRHYAEVPGYGMDLFDCGRYFSFHVPVKALNDPLLQAAACAYAAKQIARSGGVKSIRDGGHAAQVLARMEVWPDTINVNWEYIHEKYYGEAVSLLTRALAEKRHWPDSIPPTPGVSIGSEPTPPRTSDELLAATAILCEYEAMDANGVWQKHLAGAKSLLDVAEAGMHASDGLPDIHNEPKFAGARKAIFWNFARQDFAAAFITECQVRLDVTNIPMWKAAGLELDDSGCIVPNHEFSLMNPFDNHSREDMLANSLILLLCKMNNYIVVGESLYPAGPAHEGKRYEELMSGIDHVGISQQTLLERWSRISAEFDTWHANLPETFRPVKRISHPVFSEIWHSIPMCASAMQAWHMAKIILLINRPHETTARRTTIGTRLRSYVDITDETAYHAREICGIALARHEDSVRIFSIQPLFVAGSCFQKREEQEVVMGLLEGIERQLGWKTDYRRDALLKEWKWDLERGVKKASSSGSRESVNGTRIGTGPTIDKAVVASSSAREKRKSAEMGGAPTHSMAARGSGANTPSRSGGGSAA